MRYIAVGGYSFNNLYVWAVVDTRIEARGVGKVIATCSSLDDAVAIAKGLSAAEGIRNYYDGEDSGRD